MKRVIESFLRCLVLIIIFSVLVFIIKDIYTNARANKVPILTFHRIVSDRNKENKYDNNQWVASLSNFEKQMRFLYNNNYRTISIQEFDKWYNGRIELPKKTVMLTFDDGDYEFYYLVYPVLKKYNFKATAFIIGSNTHDTTEPFKDSGRYFIGKDKIGEITKDYPNIQFQSHTYNLHYYDDNSAKAVDLKSYNEINADFKRNREFAFKYIAYPYGRYNDNMIRAVKNNNIRMAFGFREYVCATRNSDKYEIPRIKINGQITYTKYVNMMNSYLENP